METDHRGAWRLKRHFASWNLLQAFSMTATCQVHDRGRADGGAGQEDSRESTAIVQAARRHQDCGGGVDTGERSVRLNGEAAADEPCRALGPGREGKEERPQIVPSLHVLFFGFLWSWVWSRTISIDGEDQRRHYIQESDVEGAWREKREV